MYRSIPAAAVLQNASTALWPQSFFGQRMRTVRRRMSMKDQWIVDNITEMRSSPLTTTPSAPTGNSPALLRMIKPLGISWHQCQGPTQTSETLKIMRVDGLRNVVSAL
jgi:hypothetical protein